MQVKSIAECSKGWMQKLIWASARCMKTKVCELQPEWEDFSYPWQGFLNIDFCF